MKEPSIDELHGKGILVNSKSIGTRYEVITIMDVTLTEGLFSEAGSLLPREISHKDFFLIQPVSKGNILVEKLTPRGYCFSLE